MRDMRATRMNVVPATHRVDIDTLGRSMKVWSFGLMGSAVLGVFSGVTGLTLNLSFLLGLAENKGLMGALAIWLLVAAFPMLWATSHCLDKVDAIDKATRLEFSRQHGLADTDTSTTHN
jgi:hypothetical protein